MSLFSVQAILILSTEDGSRIFAKYYNAPHHAAHGAQGSHPVLDLSSQSHNFLLS
jgi:hypothetical protein